ncbi:sensor histidine kinase [Methyloprofundus sp.]|uniref:sensor histidine kinase n=1 Tax=Methyloprofundus sp. TaxID=2020875 RepID=UPI003D10F695
MPSYSQLYLVSSFTYLFVSLAGWFFIILRTPSYASQAQMLVFTDIVLITIIMHACGGITSGIGALMLVSTAAGGLLIGGRCAMLFAAMASLFVFAEQSYAYKAVGFSSVSYPYAGVLGAGFFTLALLSYFLAQRTEQTERIAAQHQQTITSLEELNQYIIQNMQSGIIITNQQLEITRYNQACPRLLGLDRLPATLTEISLPLANAFTHWLRHPNISFIRLSTRELIDLQVNFTSLPTRHMLFYMITLEDQVAYNQRVQQSKLASLGQLTANIAHEIRNPLGAISHAGQLLAECPHLSSQEKRLTEIIQTHSLRMNSIIEEILQLSHKDNSKVERIHLASWLKAYLLKFKSEHIKHNKHFSLSVDAGVQDTLFDPNHLTQILNNLCENALKYSDVSNQPIRLKVSTYFNQPTIKVIDYGPGVPEASVKNLFEPFFTSSSTGTGLGLYISRGLAELNKGVLSYHSLKNEQGCYFRLCMMNAEQKIIQL